jgi:hypothetical protein
MGLLKKIGRGIKKVARKIIPKEVAGIMQVAAPFVAATPAGIPAALALSLGGQLRSGRGRISPLKTLLAIAPSETFRQFTTGQRAIGGRFGIPTIDLKGTRVARLGSGLDKLLYGSPAGERTFYNPAQPGQPMMTTNIDATQGLLGFGGEGLSPTGIIEGKLIKPDGKNISIARVFGFATAGLSLFDTKEKIKEEGEELGLEPSEIARLQQEAAEMWEDFDTTAFKPNVAQGGLMRTNYALGSMPTEQESGLGGLPIEADMRYTGGFMPYGAKEKADDVPARLSKNEFVFTADAVRGAGGGDINTGAKRMYQSMKQLEQMGKRA